MEQLVIDEVTLGTGDTAAAGKRVTVHYTGWLLDKGAKGKKFDSSKDRGDPFVFPLGQGQPGAREQGDVRRTLIF